MRRRVPTRKSYWWVILVAVPVAVALIAVLPNLLPKKPDPPPLPNPPDGGRTVKVEGSGNAI